MNARLRQALEEAAAALQLVLPRCQLRDDKDQFDATPILQALIAARSALAVEPAPPLPPLEGGFEPSRRTK